MKTYFTIVILFLLLKPCLGQPVSGSGNTASSGSYRKFTIRDTVAMPGVPRDEVYSRAWKWFSETSRQSPTLFKEANKRFGRFTGTNNIIFSSSQPGSGTEYVKGLIYYTFNVYVENEYYIYEITDFNHTARIPFNIITTHPEYPYKPVPKLDGQWHNDVWQEMKARIQLRTNPVIQSLKEGMQKETEKFDLYKQLYEKDPTNPRVGMN